MVDGCGSFVVQKGRITIYSLSVPFGCGTESYRGRIWCSVPYHMVVGFDGRLIFQGFRSGLVPVVRYGIQKAAFTGLRTTLEDGSAAARWVSRSLAYGDECGSAAARWVSRGLAYGDDCGPAAGEGVFPGFRVSPRNAARLLPRWSSQGLRIARHDSKNPSILFKMHNADGRYVIILRLLGVFSAENCRRA